MEFNIHVDYRTLWKVWLNSVEQSGKWNKLFLKVHDIQQEVSFSDVVQIHSCLQGSRLNKEQSGIWNFALSWRFFAIIFISTRYVASQTSFNVFEPSCIKNTNSTSTKLKCSNCHPLDAEKRLQLTWKLLDSFRLLRLVTFTTSPVFIPINWHELIGVD